MDNGPLTISDAAPLIHGGELTPSDLLEQCLARIDVYEPAVKAWAFLDRERARRDAARLSEEAKRGEVRGPLHGIPVGIKDIIDVFDMPTGCGSKLWANSYARKDATCVARLRQAGAIILGKTVTTPFAFLDPPPTHNPWKLGRTPGGSSSGSAAAVACGMVLAAIGTQTGGSVTRPASYCGVYSLKPTYGRISVNGVLPLAPSLDHVGVMANCVRDLAVVFQTIAGPDSSLEPGESDDTSIPDFELDEDLQDTAPRFLQLGGLFDKHLGAELRPLYESVATHLMARAGPSERGVPPSAFAEMTMAQQIIYGSEAAAYHGERFDRHPEDYPPKIRELIISGRSYLATQYTAAGKVQADLEVTLGRMVHPDLIFLTPATTDLAPTPETTGNAIFNSPWSFTGQPTLSIPSGWSEDGLPFAIQLATGLYREVDLFRAGAWCETTLGLSRCLPPVPNSQRS